MGWITFLAGALLVISVSLFTISFQAIKAAVANPVDSLRYE
jgi:putative ABC transport system permease protein